MNADPDLSPRRELVEFISTHFSSSLGADPLPVGARPHGMAAQVSPFIVGPIWGFIYSAIFCGVPFFFWHPPKDLIFLSLWGSSYLAFATTTARATSSAIFRTIKCEVVPNLSGTAAAKITAELKKDYGGMRPYLWAYFSAAIAVVISGVAIFYDLSSTSAIRFSCEGFSTSTAPIDVPEIAYYLVGFFWLYVLSAKTTYMARFYRVFSNHLESNNVYALSPAQSACIKQIESIATKILFFWFGIVCSVGTLLVIFSDSDLNRFLIVVVPSASVFSFVFGTIVFLSFERRIRKVVNSVAASTLLLLEKEIVELFERRRSLTPFEWERFGHLSSVHRALATTAQYKSTLIGTFSVVAPFVGPAVALAVVALGASSTPH